MVSATQVSVSGKLCFCIRNTNLWFPESFTSHSRHTYISSILTSLYVVVKKQTFFCRELVCFSSLFCCSFSPIFCPSATYRLISTYAFWSFCPLVPPDWCWPIYIREGSVKRSSLSVHPHFFPCSLPVWVALYCLGKLVRNAKQKLCDGRFRTTGKFGYTLSHIVVSQFFKKSSHEIRGRNNSNKGCSILAGLLNVIIRCFFLKKKQFKHATFGSGKFSWFHSFLKLYRLIDVLINRENNRNANRSKL